ncbi:hypothetical protein NB037_07610 [Rathayibacter sp. ZW T2_19]|uniref:Secreted protein n=1 Tax=Rathayibacter rubneri TaxID=2950106 RepID=A0A9X2IT93_9MICO|nr:hypothetical protein [Rathayibacter rubneri]MCM6762283.1 hypothetical protein [Rathayibacter rubneri]
MTRRNAVLGAVCLLVGAVTGCSTAGSTGSGAGRTAVTVEYTCVLQSEIGEIELGGVLSVHRGPDGPCDGLETGTTQRFELRSIMEADPVRASVDVDVAVDGSLAFDVQVPTDLRLGRALLQAVSLERECRDPAVLDCPAPTVRFVVTDSSVQDLRLASAPSPTAPDQVATLDAIGAHYRPGPLADQITVVLPGPTCETVPASFVTDAPAGSLEMVSAIRGDACGESMNWWTSVVDVPDGYADYDSVKVDNVPAALLPAP